MRVWWIVLSLNLLAFQAYGYFENANIRDKIKDDKDRIFSPTEKYALAVDGTLFKYGNIDDYYHGNGYWVDVRVELSPSENLIFNQKLISYNGASSYGYARGSNFMSLVGVTYRTKDFCESCRFEMRASDVGRQTLGAGLTLEDEEVNGGTIEIANDWWRYKLIANGTAGFYLSNDFLYQQIDYAKNLIGLSVLGFIEPKLPPTISLFSTYKWDSGLYYKAEVAHRNSAMGALASIGISGRSGRVDGFAEYQFRSYADKFGEDFIGKIEHDYLGLDTRDKNFTNIKTIFVLDDNLNVHAGRLDLRYHLSDLIQIVTENEGGIFQFRDRAHLSYFFTRSGFRFFIVPNRKDSLAVFFTNKYFPFQVTDLTGVPEGYGAGDSLRYYHSKLPFYDRSSLGVEATFSF